MAEDESKAAVSKDCLYDNFCVFVVLLFSLNLIQSQDSKEPEAKLHSFLCFRNSCIWMRCWCTATFGPGTNGWCCGNEGQPIQSGHCFNSWSIMMCMLIWRMNRDLLLRSLRPKVLGKRIVMAKLCVFMLAGVEAQGQTQQQGMACCGDLILGCHVHFNLPQAVKPADSATGEAHHHCCMVGTLKMKLSDICRSYQEDPAKTKAAEKDHWVSMRCVAVCARFFSW